MLSFLKEQKVEDSSSERPCEAPGKLSAESQEQGYVAVVAQEKNVRKTTYILATVFCIGILCLWFMAKKSTPKQAAADTISPEEAQIEQVIARFGGTRSEILSSTDEIVRKFHEFSDVEQVGVDELVKNPFKHDLFLDDLDGSDNYGWESDEAEAMRQEQMARGMQLLSIMKSETGSCCMIDDKLLYEGDSIKGFKVCQIEDNFIRLASEGTEVILKLEE
jgi:preprotein translocase subunit SecG